MGRIFKLYEDLYDQGISLYKNNIIEINTGLTVLVGCNGIGKTSLFYSIKNVLKKEKIPYMEFDNLNDGGDNSRNESLYYGDINFLIESLYSSEGENIMFNIAKIAAEIGKFVKTGIYKYNIQSDFKSNEIWILFDAIDSGLSIDNIVELKNHLFKTILQFSFSKEIYIVISANEYEMARGEQCFDVYNGKYITFKDYEDYRNMILKSKRWKQERNKARKNCFNGTED